MSNTRSKRDRGDPARRLLRARLLVGLTSLALVGLGVQVLSPAAALAADPPCGQGHTSPTTNPNGDTLIPFADAVGQPLVATPDHANHYTLTAQQHSTHSFSPANHLPAVPTLGYSTANQQMDYLGPTIVTKQGTPTQVTLHNGLSTTPLFPDQPASSGNKVVMHRHGGIQTVGSDGTPSQGILPTESRTNTYPNSQAAAPLWYHDHMDSTTSYNVYGGLAGFMPNTDTTEPKFGLPSGNQSLAYVLQDKSFDANWNLCYTHASPEFFGDTAVVNGTIAPHQTVEPRRYKFTFINGSDSRFYHLSLTGGTGTAPSMTVVGSDSGYVFRPVPVSSLLIAPGERYTVVVDFTGRSGQWVLSNDAAAPFPFNDPDIAAVPQLMRFDVGATVTGTDTSKVPPTLPESNNSQALQGQIAQARLRTVQAAEPVNHEGEPLLGNATALLPFSAPATETPQLGSSEVWAMRNHSPDSHPIHEHLVELYLIGRWPATFGPQDPLTGSATPVTVGAFQPAPAYEAGPKDTFVSPPNFITAWVGKYTIGTGTENSVWHCHILSHEDAATHPMMRPLAVGTVPQTQLPVVQNLGKLDTLVRQP